MIKQLLRKIATLVSILFKPFGLKHKIVEVPKKLKKRGRNLAIIQFSITLLGLAFSFLLKATNVMIELKFVILGVVFFMLYYGEQVLRSSLDLIIAAESKKYQFMFDNEIILRGSKILSEVTDKVHKKDEKTNVYSIMSNESVINTIKRYLSNLWELKINNIFNILGVISAILMLVVAVITNNAISQSIFIPVLVIFAITAFATTVYLSISRKTYHEKFRKNVDEEYEITNDLLRVTPIVKKDVSMRINLLSQTIKENNSNFITFDKKVRVSRLIMCIVETLATYGIILLYIFGVNWQNITVATIAEITANIVIVTAALRNITRITDSLDRYSERVTVITREEAEMKLITETYDKVVERNNEDKPVDRICIPKFKISYIEESENDKPFTLKSEREIVISTGDVAILYGPSGSGKSTFMKLITERIVLNKSVDVPSTSRFLYYDEKLRFGSLSVYKELFCNDEQPNLAKMQNILVNLHLWQEITINCVDAWQYLKEKKYNHFSNGQKQRLILAKMLYWLDENIDVLVLDECTSGLDDVICETEGANAQEILEYITTYANRDKQRIIVISTHQNIDDFISKIDQDYNIQKLQFVRKGDCNIVG